MKQNLKRLRAETSPMLVRIQSPVSVLLVLKHPIEIVSTIPTRLRIPGTVLIIFLLIFYVSMQGVSLLKAQQRCDIILSIVLIGPQNSYYQMKVNDQWGSI